MDLQERKSLALSTHKDLYERCHTSGEYLTIISDLLAIFTGPLDTETTIAVLDSVCVDAIKLRDKMLRLKKGEDKVLAEVDAITARLHEEWSAKKQGS